jgi:nitronate monooxygenase
MKWNNMPTLRIGDIEARLPIVQGGMGVAISRAGLAAAVANAGGIGVIASVGLDLDDLLTKGRIKGNSSRHLIAEIQRARSMTNGILGVNVMVALSDYTQLVDAAIEADIDVLFLGAGLPLHFSENLTVERMQTVRSKFVPIVSSARAVDLIFQYWAKKYHRVPDGVVVEGPKAGGHLGFRKEHIMDPDYALEKLIPPVVASVKPFAETFNKEIPVIAAGGIFNGQDIYDIMQLGASGVQMATRFIATHECDADLAFKQAILDAEKEDITIIDSPVGLPGRAVRNRFLEDVSAGIKAPFTCPYKCLKTCDYKTAPYCIALALDNARRGRLQNGFAFTGANAYRVHEIVSVQALMESLQEEYTAAVSAVHFPIKATA